MKTLRYYLDKLDKTPQGQFDHKHCCVYTNTLAPAVGITHPFESWEAPKEFTCFFGYSWICTDTAVGLRFYFLNDELICASFQRGRKCDEEFDWVSVDAFNKVRKLLIDLMVKELTENTVGDVSLIDWNQDFSLMEDKNTYMGHRIVP